MTPAEPQTGGPRGVTRALHVVEAVASGRIDASLAGLSVALDIPKSSLLGVLRALVASGHLSHDGGRYGLGPASFRLGSEILRQRRFPDVLHPLLEQLAQEARATVYLCVIDRERCKVRYLDGVESPEPVRFWIPPGEFRPLHCSSAGLVLLAYEDSAFQERALQPDMLVGLTPLSVTSATDVRRRLEQARIDGYALNRDESVCGASGIAAPIRGTGGVPIAAVVVGVPSSQFAQRFEELHRRLIAATAQASLIMGFSPSGPPSRRP